MKKTITVFLVSALLLLSACASSTPAEKLDSYIMKNGTAIGEEYVLDCPEVIDTIKGSDFTIAHMENLQGSTNTEFQLIKGESGVSIKLTDSSITDNGMKLERTVSIAPDGKFEFKNSIVMNGVSLGVELKGEIPMETYTKENTPLITESKLSSGANLTDEVKATLKDYIDLALDCYSQVITQENPGITLADMGYSSYAGN